MDVRYSSGDTQTVNIFQLSINHFDKPKNVKYAYLVLPNIAEEKMMDYYKNVPVKILENSKNIQAIQLSDSIITEIVFYKKGSIAITESLKISVDRPAIVMLQKYDNQLNLSIADPNQYEEEIIVTVNAKLEAGKNIVYNPKTGNSRITFTLPQNIYLGKTIHQNFVITQK